MTPKKIDDYFEFESAPRSIRELQTPIPLVDLDIVERNIRNWQIRCDQLGMINRPHIKTHKLGPLARFQVDCGASGITVQKLGEAEIMADHGISDMLLTFNVVGRQKLMRLSKLARRIKIDVVADNPSVADGLALSARGAGSDLGVLVECDTGGLRNGVQSPSEAAKLAARIAGTPGLFFAGLMTYPAAGGREKASRFLKRAKDLIERAGLKVSRISSGGTPDMMSAAGLEIVSEYRVGTYAYNDRSLINSGVCNENDCALTVLSTVVSRPTPERAVIDAGSKSLTSDLLGLDGYGITWESQLVVYAVSEEHGLLNVGGVAAPPVVGDSVRIIPNHVCPVSNLFDKVALIRGEHVLGFARVNARGAVT